MYYILEADGYTPRPVDVITWGRWFEESTEKRIVAQTETPHGTVSTVFLGMDHDILHTSASPVLWETLVFDQAGNGGEQERYTSRADAEEGHRRMVAEYESRGKAT